MKAFLFTLISLLTFSLSYSQVNGNVPADSLYTPLPYIHTGTFITDSSGDQKPFLYTKTEYFPRSTAVYSYVIISAKDGKELSRNFRPVPKQYMHKVKADKNDRYRDLTGMGNSDSVYRIDQHAWDSLYKLFPLPTDTILVANEKVALYYSAVSTSMSSYCNYEGDVKNGMEFTYYNMPELKGVVVKKNFRLKSAGRWKDGKKNGKWYYYNTDGSVMKIEKWKNGELKRERKVK
ncbi:MAG TPA: hypothetical protein VL651_10000 [Bacteroidia bacterium]|jgi:antitoxin component YwqK of YwqJK toxin-antitoxin module|nr:hypothetical protein [Bacteroidia bacterium]